MFENPKTKGRSHSFVLYRNRILRLIFFLIILFVWSDAHANKRIVRLTSGEWPPYTSKDLKDYGIFSKIVTQAFIVSGYEVEYGFFPWMRSHELAKGGSWDGSVAWQATKEREKDFYISDPVISSQKVFFHRKNLSFTWNELKDLQGMRVGTTRGYSYSPTFRSMAQRNGLVLIDVDSDILALKLMLKGRIDLHPNDLHVGKYIINHYFATNEAEQFTYHPKSFYEADDSVIFPKILPDSQKLMNALNHGLKTLKKSGQYEEIIAPKHDKKIKILVALAHWPPGK